VAPEPMREPQTAAFPAAKIAPFLRAVVDPEGKGDLTPEQAAAIQQVEANVARSGQRR
jgi:hypothetical protein